MSLPDLINRMVAAGMSPGEAGAIAAEIYAAGVASASCRSSNAERQKRYRDRNRNESVTKRNESVTERNGDSVTKSVTKRNESVTRDASAVSYIDTKIKNSIRQNSERASRGTRIDPNWSPSVPQRDFAFREGLSGNEIDREASRFRDYWKGRAGSGGVKLDWNATWQNWIRSAAEKLGRSPRSAPTDDQVPGFYAKFGSEEQDAWDRYGQAKTGKTFPRDNKGGWRHPTQWPPGYAPPEARDPTPLPMLKAM